MDLRDYLFSRKPATPVASEGDNVVGFGERAKDTWKQIWENKADGYADFILRVKCIPNSKMFKLQQYIRKQQAAESCATPTATSTTSAVSVPPSFTIG